MRLITYDIHLYFFLCDTWGQALGFYIQEILNSYNLISTKFLCNLTACPLIESVGIVNGIILPLKSCTSLLISSLGSRDSLANFISILTLNKLIIISILTIKLTDILTDNNINIDYRIN